MTRAQLIAALIAVLVVLVVIELVRREKLTFKYAAGWMMASALALFFSIFDTTLFRLSLSSMCQAQTNDSGSLAQAVSADPSGTWAIPLPRSEYIA